MVRRRLKRWMKRAGACVVALAIAYYIAPVSTTFAAVAFGLVLLCYLLGSPLRLAKVSRRPKPDRFRDSLRTAEQVLTHLD